MPEEAGSTNVAEFEFGVGKRKTRRSHKTTDRKAERRDRIRDELFAIRRGLVLAHLEGAAAVADIVKNSLDRTLEDETIGESETIGDLMRNTSSALRDAKRDAFDDLAEVPGKMVDKFHAEYREKESK